MSGLVFAKSEAAVRMERTEGRCGTAGEAWEGSLRRQQHGLLGGSVKEGTTPCGQANSQRMIDWHR